MTKSQVMVIVEMYRDDASYAEIATELGISDNIVKHWVRQNRDKFGLAKRRNLAEKVGALSTAAWADSKWNLKRGVEYITRHWRTNESYD